MFNNLQTHLTIDVIYRSTPHRSRPESSELPDFLAKKRIACFTQLTRAIFSPNRRIIWRRGVGKCIDVNSQLKLVLDLLLCKLLPVNKTGAEIFRFLDDCFRMNDIPKSNCIVMCNDGAKAMTRRGGVITWI